MNRTRNRVIRHLVLIILGVLITALVYAIGNQKNALANFSIATAYSSIVFLVITLVIGPIRVLGKKANPVSSYLRRDVGIWSGILAITHTIVGLQVHLAGRMHLYFVFPPERQKILPFRYDAFGIANYSGLVAVAIICLLLFLSNNVAIKRLGAEKWKSRQRLSYLMAILALLHGVIYQQLEDRSTYYVVVLLSLFFIAVVFQVAGILSNVHCTKSALKRNPL